MTVTRLCAHIFVASCFLFLDVILLSISSLCSLIPPDLLVAPSALGDSHASRGLLQDTPAPPGGDQVLAWASRGHLWCLGLLGLLLGLGWELLLGEVGEGDPGGADGGA